MPKIGDTQEPKPTPKADAPAAFGGAPTIAHGYRLQSGPGDELYPRAYGGAPTMMRQKAPKRGSGSGDSSGGGGTVGNSPSFNS